MKEFMNIINPLIQNQVVRSMDTIPHHTQNISCFDHSIYVAYVSYLVGKNLSCNLESLTRSAMLHDLYLCNWKQEKVGVFKRLKIHPHLAIENAGIFGLSGLEKNIIKKHMWPINILDFPNKKEELIVNFADKLCTISEITGIYWLVPCSKQFNHKEIKGGVYCGY